MFEDSLLESARHISKRRGWMTLLSTSIQILLMALLVILPLLRTSAISPQTNRITVVTPYPSEPTATGAHPPSGAADSGGPRPTVIRVAQPFGHISLHDSDPVGPVSPPTVPTCFANCGTLPGFPGPGDGGTRVTLKPADQHMIISRLDPGQIIRRVEPLYPPLARTARIQGAVVLHAIISRDGVIERLQVVHSDHPLLDRAALDAVSQWRFRPYILNREPIEVETEITVNFILAR